MNATPSPPGADSIPLESFEETDKDTREPRLKISNVKLLVSLFAIFMVISSDVFINSVISGFGEKAIKGRDLTTWGTVLQGIFLVIFYIMAIYLTEHNIL